MNSRNQIFKEMDTLLDQGVTKGNLSSQDVWREDAQGQRYKSGTYYTLTWSDNGKKKTKRIPASDVKEVEQRVERYKQMKLLFNELLRIGEQKKVR